MQKIALLAILSLALSSCAELATYTGSSGENDVALGEEDSTAPNEETDAGSDGASDTVTGEETNAALDEKDETSFAEMGTEDSEILDGIKQMYWSCKESPWSEPALGLARFGGLGFIVVFDELIAARFSMDGLRTRWDWGQSGDSETYKYSLVLEPTGNAIYYDFSTSASGTTLPPTKYYCSEVSL